MLYTSKKERAEMLKDTVAGFSSEDADRYYRVTMSRNDRESGIYEVIVKAENEENAMEIANRIEENAVKEFEKEYGRTLAPNPFTAANSVKCSLKEYEAFKSKLEEDVKIPFM